MNNNTEISLEYGDVLKAYQSKVNELLTQLITAEAKLNASAALIMNLRNSVKELESQINKEIPEDKNKKSPVKKSSTETVVDYNS